MSPFALCVCVCFQILICLLFTLIVTVHSRLVGHSFSMNVLHLTIFEFFLHTLEIQISNALGLEFLFCMREGPKVHIFPQACAMFPNHLYKRLFIRALQFQPRHKSSYRPLCLSSSLLFSSAIAFPGACTCVKFSTLLRFIS